MEFIVNLLRWLASVFGSIVDFGQFVQTNIIILMIAVVVFAVSVVFLRSLFKILLFIPVLIFATFITIWIVNSLTGTGVTLPEIDPLFEEQIF